MSIATIAKAEEREAAPGLIFSVDWFSQHIPMWEAVVEQLPARGKFLEIGSFEGRSACWMFEHALADDGELYCVDTWAGSPEFDAVFQPGVVDRSLERFKQNTAIARLPTQRLFMFPNTSMRALAALIAADHVGSFDLIYVDGSHTAADTLADAVMAWPLLKQGGIMIFDDYLWSLEADVARRPKQGIDIFTALWNPNIRTLACGAQYAIQRIA